MFLSRLAVAWGVFCALSRTCVCAVVLCQALNANRYAYFWDVSTVDGEPQRVFSNPFTQVGGCLWTLVFQRC